MTTTLDGGAPRPVSARAVVVRAFRDPAQIAVEPMTVPPPGPGEARLRVAAAGVNFPDLLVVDRLYQILPALPFSPGKEAAG